MLALTIFGIAGVIGVAATGLVLVYARRRLLDQVNERSSHAVPTPRGGGLGLVLGVAVAWAVGLSLATAWSPSTGGVLAGALLLAGLGWWDDHAGLSARLRLPVQLAVSALAAWALGLPATITMGQMSIHMPIWVLGPLAVIAATWLINLTNFMDGIDGIAGGQGLVAGLAGALLLGATPLGGLGWAVAGASLGFLWWNRPPARIFMGDVGSTVLGLLIAVLMLAELQAGVPVELALLPVAPFFIDATCTLLRRAWRRERLSQAHRSHLYQRLARRWASHLPVSLLYTGLAALGTLGAVAGQRGWITPWLPVTLMGVIFAGLVVYGRRVEPA